MMFTCESKAGRLKRMHHAVHTDFREANLMQVLKGVQDLCHQCLVGRIELENTKEKTAGVSAAAAARHGTTVQCGSGQNVLTSSCSTLKLSESGPSSSAA